MSKLIKSTRRDFLKVISAGTCGALVHRAITPARNMLAFAAPGVSIGSNPVFILVNLAGGCSLNITPFYSGTYRDLNPTISYGPEDSLALNSSQGLHPALTGLKSIWDEGSLAIVNMVGYPDPDRSHENSTEIFLSGVRSMTGAYGGWAPRLTCQMASTFAGISLAGANTVTNGECNPPRALNNIANLGEETFYNNLQTRWLRDTRANLILESTSGGGGNQAFVRTSIEKVDQSMEMIGQYANTQLPTQFPNTGFGNACRDAAKLINAPQLGTRFIYLQTGGYDTHSNEKPELTNRLSELNGGLTALVQQIKASGRWNDVVICTMSEFSRTYQNGSNGTDHGHSSAVMVAGGAVKGGIKTPAPTDAEFLKDNYLRDYHVDFRRVFAEIIKAMKYDPNKVFLEPYVGGGSLALI